jgi:hypothetical protein
MHEGRFLLLTKILVLFFSKNIQSFIYLIIIIILSPIMLACGDGSTCKDKSLPLEGHHACALYEVKLHGICSRFYNEDSIKYQNICFNE